MENEEKQDGQNLSDEFQDHLEIIIDPGQVPIRIDKFLVDRMRNATRNRIQNAIKAGAITVDSKEVKPNFKIKPGHKIEAVIPRHPGYGDRLAAENIPLDIVYEDDSVLVINKPAGMVVHPGVGNYTGTLVNALAYYFQDRDMPVMEGNDHNRIGLVHRIDKDTTGLLVIAKDDYSMSHLSKQFFQHTIERKYRALVWGQPEEEEGTITCNVGRHPRHRIIHTCFPDGDAGKHAVTHYKLIEGLYYVSLVECELETGRTHQIRVHMKHIGHTLFADHKYGGNEIKKGTVHSKYRQFVDNCFRVMNRQALHAYSLGFEHPVTKEKMYFEAELPDDFKAVMEKWRIYVNDRRSKMPNFYG